ncbi:hypothetical protein MTO96_036609, partial [Rhipicephalus appendiculatus]
NGTVRYKSTDGTNYNFETHVYSAAEEFKYLLLYVDCANCKIMKCPTSEYTD